MDIGIRDDRTVVLCIDTFIEQEVLLLCKAFHTCFTLETSPLKRRTSTWQRCWRITCSAKKEILLLLQTIVRPYMIPDLYPKLGSH